MLESNPLHQDYQDAISLAFELKRALLNTWAAIAPDILTGSVTFTRDQVVETVLDSNYLEACNRNVDVSIFRSLPYDEQIKIARSAFTSKRYGL